MILIAHVEDKRQRKLVFWLSSSELLICYDRSNYLVLDYSTFEEWGVAEFNIVNFTSLYFAGDGYCREA